MADVYLTQRDIDYISRVVATEVPPSLAQSDPEEYSRMVNAVVDTVTNRMASESYPSTATGVLNQNRQFSKITGPSALDPYGSVQNTPKASPELQSMVAGHIADISQGLTKSEIGGSVNYANPNFSSANNLRDWVNPMIEAGALKLGLGDMVHYHGVIPGTQPVGDYNLSAEGIPTTANVAVPVANPTKGLLSVVDPFDPNVNLRTGSLLAPTNTDWEAMAQANQQEFSNPGLLGPNVDVLTASRQEIAPTEAASMQPGEWGVINGVAPVPYETFNQWDAVANARPVQAPVQQQEMAVQAEGLLGANPGLSASAAAVPTQQASLASNLGLFSDAMAAQRGPTTGMLSAEMDALRGNTEAQLQDPSRLAPMVEQPMNVAASGLLGTNSPLSAQATVQPAEQQVASINPGLLSPSSIATSSAPLSFNKSLGILNQPAVDPQYMAMTQPTVNAQQMAAPALETVQVADQPAVADVQTQVEGPATTPALEQQQQQQVQKAVNNTPSVTTQSQVASKPTLGQRITKAVNPGTLGGGLLGGLALGPVGGLVGGLLGNAAYQNGGISGLLGGPSWSAPSTQIGGGMANIAGLYGGAYSPGTFAVANNGATITAQPGGYVTYTNSYGVTESIGPDGKIAGYFGSGATPADQETDTDGRTGGLFGGLFG